MRDQPTLDFYAREAEAYASRYAVTPELSAFMARLAAGAKVLELGCGGGQDSAAMLAEGFDVTPTDGSPELAREAAKRIGRPVQVLLFEDIDFNNAFDAVWANACLLHAPKTSLPSIFAKIHGALKPDGLFQASFKTDGAEGVDRFGRYYNHPDEPFLREALGTSWSSIEMFRRSGSGYYNLPAEWLHVIAIKA